MQNIVFQNLICENDEFVLVLPLLLFQREIKEAGKGGGSLTDAIGFTRNRKCRALAESRQGHCSIQNTSITVALN